MKAKEKAKELFDKYFDFVGAFTLYQQHENAKQCALKAVDEIFNDQIILSRFLPTYKPFKIEPKYWQDVKDEIKKL